MAATLLSSTLGFLIVIAMILGFFGFLIYIIFFRGKKDTFEDFKQIPTTETQYKELKKIVKTSGKKVKKGKLIRGIHKIGNIHKIIGVKGKFSTYGYDENKKEYYIDEGAEKKEYHLLIFMCHNPFFLYNWLFIKKIFFMIDKKSIKEFDPNSNSYVIDSETDLKPIGDIWINSADGLEYLQDISIKRMNIELMTALENYPNKIVHLEMQQAKKERLYREIMETDRAKYDAIKKAEDTAIS